MRQCSGVLAVAALALLVALDSAAAAAADGHLSLLRRAATEGVTVRQETCRFCYRECNIACFVGTCGMEYGFSVSRYKFTNACWTCDASSSVGINKMGDFSVCSADEAAATRTYPKVEESEPPQGPGIPGDAVKEAQEAKRMAHTAAASALKASQHADKAAMAALAKLNSVMGVAGHASDAIELAEAHRLALQIRANEAKKTMESAQMAQKLAADKFNAELAKLKRQQLETNGAEMVLQGAEKYAENTQNEYTKAAAAAAQAARDAAALGASAAGASAQEAAAKEMLAAARAAQRRAMDAAQAAKSAAEKADMASSIADIPAMPDPTTPPCAPSLLQGGGAGGAVKNCAPSSGGLKVNATRAKRPPVTSPEQKALTSAQQALEAAEAGPLSAPAETQAALGSALSSAQQALNASHADEDVTGTDAVVEEPGVLLKPPALADTLVAKLASKLADDPEAAGNPQNFDIAQMPDVQAQLQAQAQEKYEAAGKLIPDVAVSNGALDDGSSVESATDPVAGLPMDPSQVPTVNEGLAQTGFSALAMSSLQIGVKVAAPEVLSLGGEGGELFDAAAPRSA